MTNLADSKPKRSENRVVAIVDNFPSGPLLSPTRIDSLDELSRVFSHEAMTWSCTLGARMYFELGGTQALVTRTGGPERSTAPELVVGISALAMSQEHWDFLRLTSLMRLNDVDFNVVVRHATLVGERMGRGIEIFDPRNVLADIEH